MVTALALCSVLLLVAVNALFVATEFALVAARPTVLADAAERGSRAASRALRARRDLRLQMSGAQLGITASSIALGVLAEPAIGGLLEDLFSVVAVPEGAADTASWVAAIGLAAVIQMLFGELVPKNLAIAAPERTLRWTVTLHTVFVSLTKPAVVALDRVSALLIRPFGLTAVDEIHRAVGAAELTSMLDASRKEGLIDGFEHDLLSGALDLGRRTVASVMVPRPEVVTVDRWAPVHEVERVLASSGHSRLPLTGPDGGLVGLVHARSVLRLPVGAADDTLTTEEVRTMAVLSPDQPLDEVLHLLQRERIRLAAVIGTEGWIGIVSLEDVLEELVGDIRDETDGYSAGEIDPSTTSA
jgi:CBS domain containing-hemolysin-like protein